MNIPEHFGAGLLAAGVCLTAAAPARAAIPENDYFVLGVGYLAPDQGRNSHHGVGGSAGYARGLADQLWIEGRLFANVLEPTDSQLQAFSQSGLGADLVYQPGGALGGLFFLAGGGGAYNDVTPDALDGGSGYADFGAGWRDRPDPASAVRYRVELRGIADSFDSGQTDVLLGLVVEFSPRPAAAPAPAAPMRIVRIEPPAPPPVVLDADGDGIPDVEDRCSATLRGAKVEADGCVWQEQVVTMSNLRFPSGSDRLNADVRTRLDEVVRFFANQPDVRMDIYGHTDGQGAEAYNLKLSKGRAASVRAYLVKKGISAQRLTSDGFGESQPIADNASDEGRSINRRVDLHIHARQPT